MKAGEDLLALAERALKAASADGAHAEVVLHHVDAVSTTARGGRDQGRSAERVRVGVRVHDGARIAFGTGAGDGEAAVELAVKRARLALDVVPAPRHAPAAFPEGARGVAPGFHRTAHAFTADAVARAALEAAERLEEDGRASYAACIATGSVSRYVTMNTMGACVADASEAFALTVDARFTLASGPRGLQSMALGGDVPDVRGAVDALLADVDALATPAAFRASTVDVLFDAATESTFHPTFLLQLKRPLLKAGASRFSAGKSAIRSGFTLTDTVDAPGRTRRFDDEGVGTRPLTVVRDGVAHDPLLTAAEAVADGVDAPGKGFRHASNVREAPYAAPVNLTLAPGARSLDEIVAERERVVVVRRDLVGWFHSVSHTGRFSVVAPAAFLYEHGRCKGALPKATIGGNVFDALARDGAEVGAESLQTQLGRGAPLLLPGLAVAV